MFGALYAKIRQLDGLVAKIFRAIPDFELAPHALRAFDSEHNVHRAAWIEQNNSEPSAVQFRSGQGQARG